MKIEIKVGSHFHLGEKEDCSDRIRGVVGKRREPIYEIGKEKKKRVKTRKFFHRYPNWRRRNSHARGKRNRQREARSKDPHERMLRKGAFFAEKTISNNGRKEDEASSQKRRK